MQRARWTQAGQAGQGGQWLANHPGIQQRIGRVDPTSGQATRIQNFMGTAQSQRSQMPRPPTAQPQRGGAGGRRMMGQRPPAQAMSALPNYGVNPGMQSVLQSRASQGPPQGWSGDNASMQGQLAAQAGGGGGYGGGMGGGSWNDQTGYTPFSQQNMGGAIGNYGGGGGQPQPMSGYGGNAYGAQMGGMGGPNGSYLTGYGSQQGGYGGGGPREGIQNFGQTTYQGPQYGGQQAGGYGQQQQPFTGQQQVMGRSGYGGQSAQSQTPWGGSGPGLTPQRGYGGGGGLQATQPNMGGRGPMNPTGGFQTDWQNPAMY